MRRVRIPRLIVLLLDHLVGEDFVGSRDLFEAIFITLLACRRIWVMLLCQLVKLSLDFILRRC